MSGLTPANPHQSQRRSRARRPPPEPRWATMNEAVEYSRIPRRTLRRWIKEGRLPGYRIGPRFIQVDSTTSTGCADA